MIWLWKETREHRMLFLQLALLIPIVAMLALFGIRQDIVPSQRFLDGGSALGLGLGIAVLAPSLVSREMTLDHVTFLRRTPRGAAPALFAKLGLLVLGIALLALYGHVCARFAWTLLASHPIEHRWNVGHALDLGIALLVAVWVFAITAWLAHSTLSVPVAIFLLLVCAFPLHAVRRQGVTLSTATVATASALLALGALWIARQVLVRQAGNRTVLATLATLFVMLAGLAVCG